ncbi:hypothetical protein KIN20_024903, partial [Parelaphostrongylus tenuis]
GHIVVEPSADTPIYLSPTPWHKEVVDVLFGQKPPENSSNDRFNVDDAQEYNGITKTITDNKCTVYVKPISSDICHTTHTSPNQRPKNDDNNDDFDEEYDRILELSLDLMGYPARFKYLN